MPSVMQYVKKLAKLVGEHIRKGVNVKDFGDIIRNELLRTMPDASV